MKGSLVTSSVLHALVLTAALVSLGSPAKFEVADVEALPVDIIPVESITQIQQGDKSAEVKEKASPVPTTKPTEVENAENAGDNDIDLKTPPTPDKKPVNTETAAAPEKVEKVLPTPEPADDVAQEIQKVEPETQPSTEVAALPEPKTDITPEATPEEEPAETAPAESTEADALPENIPTPLAKPKVETKTQVAKTPERKKDEPKKEQKKAASSKESDFNADEVAALLNKTESAGGGAKRSTEQAALGAKKTTSGSKLTQSEMDALRGQIQNNWSIIPGMADAVLVTVTMQLDRNGDVVGEPEIEASGGSDAARRAMIGSAKRAIMKSKPFKNLPADKYDSWSEVVVNFDPSSML